MTDVVRILIVDDSEDDRELYRRALIKSTSARYEIEDAPDGDRGLARIEARQPDCILLDYSLPGRNGIEVLKRIHADRPFIPVVMLTGQGNEAIAVTAIREGAQNYISKSTITPETIQRAIQVAIEHCAMEKRIDEQRKSLEIFTRALAHDLKEPVRTIKSFLDLLGAQEAFTERGRTHFAYLRKAANRMGSLIDTVHFYTRLDGTPEDIPKESCPAGAVLEEVKENLAELISERKPDIVCGSLPHVFANRMQLLQVLQNLLHNAIRHGGPAPRIVIEASDRGAQWEIRVRDNGPGIGAKERERIFDPFIRLAGGTGTAGGLGMGLAICKRIVEAHGGSIRCDEAAGGGACFCFTLPKADAPDVAADAPEKDSVAPQSADALANVLLVDDNEADLELTQIMLGEKAKLKCNFLVAQDAYQALDVLRKPQDKAVKVDLMLLDINMPGMTGLELLSQMRVEDDLRNIPVVICSTSAYDKDVTRARELGAVGYIHKPTEMTKLEPLLGKVSSLVLAPRDGAFFLYRAA
jgi:signal transduction histidine kinase